MKKISLLLLFFGFFAPCFPQQTANQKQPDGTFKIQKMTFYKISNDKVRQHGESSIDVGKSWKTDFDLEYRRKK